MCTAADSTVTSAVILTAAILQGTVIGIELKERAYENQQESYRARQLQVFSLFT